MPKARRNSRQAGFSLVEVLVGFVLFGLLTLVLIGALRLGLIGSGRVEAATGELEQRQTASLVLDRLLRRAEPASDWSERDARAAFTGAAHALSFVTVLPDGLGGRLGLVRLVQRGDRLEAEICAIAPAAARAADRLACRGAAERFLLAADVRRVDFAYFGAPGPGEAARWLGAWHERNELPRAVRVAVETGRGTWPELVLRPAIEVAP